MTETILYDYPKSSASYRVRIALNLAGISYRSELVNLLKGEHQDAPHMERNPQGFVPVLRIDGQSFTQSLAILGYLNDTREIELLPQDPAQKAKVQALAMSVAVDVHPVCNLSVVKHATGGEEPARTEWMQHFIGKGLAAFEALLAEFEQAPFATGDTVSLADVCLMPQLYNARRWGADFSQHKRICNVEKACSELEAFQRAHPDRVH